MSLTDGRCMVVTNWISQRIFNAVHRHNLVYNTCWEDPRLDRKAMQLGPRDTVAVITSAGCNALDYLLDDPAHVHAVDMNPRQNALLELKVAGIRQLEFEDFWAMFGEGRLNEASSIYWDCLRDNLSPWSQGYWDRKIGYFDHDRRTFYYRGTSGYFARLVVSYMRRFARIGDAIDQLLEAPSLEHQKSIFDEQILPRLWSRTIRFAMRRDTVLSMVGVPRAQRRQIETQYDGGILQFVQDCVTAVFSHIPLSNNYFWRVYMTGRYSRECCPEYLKPANFLRLKNGLVDRLSTHTNTMQGFLEQHQQPISRFVLLDHMDWMASYRIEWLQNEWQAIADRAAADARILWRSGGLQTDFVDQLQVRVDGKRAELGELLRYRDVLARELHEQCRVHTYGCFRVADAHFVPEPPAPRDDTADVESHVVPV